MCGDLIHQTIYFGSKVEEEEEASAGAVPWGEADEVLVVEVEVGHSVVAEVVGVALVVGVEGDSRVPTLSTYDLHESIWGHFTVEDTLMSYKIGSSSLELVQ